MRDCENLVKLIERKNDAAEMPSDCLSDGSASARRGPKGLVRHALRRRNPYRAVGPKELQMNVN